MRLIGTLPDQRQTLEFSHFLTREGIDNIVEPNFEIWVVDEDRLDEALALLKTFQANPHDPKYRLQHFRDEEETEAAKPTKRAIFPGASKMGKATLGILLVAIALFLIGELNAMRTPKEEPRDIYLLGSPIYEWLLYDYPEPFQVYNQITTDYKGQLDNLPPKGQALLKRAQETPYWQGIYGEFIQRYRDPDLGWSYEGPLFEKIGQGQIWRIVSPALLHGGLLHIFFNAIWILILGNQVEARTGKWRYLLFCLVAAAISNTAQYLMSGPLFFGLSGIVCALFGFIWMRQRMAPWEGYQLNRATIIFISIYILGMAALGVFTFISQLAGSAPLGVPIANTAHIVGALCGIALGRFNLFSLQEKTP